MIERTPASSAAPVLLPVASLQPHPDNPRMLFREDVVERLTGWIKTDGFHPEHALIVRPLNGGYQIIAGHHRHLAAKRAGITEAPCWVRDMDDEEAFLALVTSNEQSELDPLEIGLHVLRSVALSEGGRGLSDGLREYARRIGRVHGGLVALRQAAEIWTVLVEMVSRETGHSGDQFPDGAFFGKSKHLAEIHAAPREAWLPLAAHLVKEGWSVSDTRAKVAKVREFTIPDRWAFFLPVADVVERHLADEFSPRTVNQLTTAAEEIERYLAGRPDGAEQLAEFEAWLTAGIAGESWEPRNLTAYHQRLLSERLQVKGWRLGNWRDHVAELDDGASALLLTDPPYGMNYRSGYRGEQHDPIAADGQEAIAELRAMLWAFLPKLATDAHVLVFCHWRLEPTVRSVLEFAGLTVRGSLVWAKNNTSMGDLTHTFAPKHERILHATKGSPTLYQRAPDVLIEDRQNSDRHSTEKPVELLAKLIEATTTAGQLVVDPFGGVASTLVAAEQCGRQRWGCELDERYHAIGEERLAP